MNRELPAILLRRWASNESTAVLKLEVFLNVEAEIVAIDLKKLDGFETEGALAAFKLGELSVSELTPR